MSDVQPMTRRAFFGACVGAFGWAASPALRAASAAPSPPAPFSIGDVERRTFAFFWQIANPDNGLMPDHWPPAGRPFASISATGFALTAYPIGVARGWITRRQAVRRTLATLRYLYRAPQGPAARGTAGFHGFFYHFLDVHTGLRYADWSHVSTIDTALCMAGVLTAASYFQRDDPMERGIRVLAEAVYRAVDWRWAMARPPLLSMDWSPQAGFNPVDWRGYNEAMILYLLALGSPTHALPLDAWGTWTSGYDRTWGSFYGSGLHVGFGPLFGHQYSEAWIDFRHIQDAFMRSHALTYFENSRRATIGQRNYAITNPRHFLGYGPLQWGLTACDGPGDHAGVGRGDRQVHFAAYDARGADVSYLVDDGTIAPTGAIGSLAFAPELVLPTIVALHARYGRWIYGSYGFVDAFNPTFGLSGEKLYSGRVVAGQGWVDDEYLGIDQGPILLMIENFRSGLIWRLTRRNPHVRRGLARAGFKGGWLN